MASGRKIVRLKKRRTINLGLIIFFVIFVYIAVYVCSYFTKSHLSIYEVQKETMALDTIAEGVIIRDETVFYTQKAGYVNYYLREGARVKKNATVYSLDENKGVYDALIDNNDTVTFSENDISMVKSRISSFQKKFSNDYSTIYSFYEEIIGTVQQLTDENLLEHLQDILKETGTASSFAAVTSGDSGVVSYHVDSLDGLIADNVSSDTFNKENFTEGSVWTMELSEQGSKAYKLIQKDEWQIVIPIEEKAYQYLIEKKQVRVKIMEDGLETTVPVSVESKATGYYATLTFDRYLSRYLSFRFLTIDFQFSQDKGLKIPLSAIVKKEFYLVPLQYFTHGGDSEQKGVITVKRSSEDDEPVYLFVETETYYEDEEYGYVDKNLFDINTFLFDQNTGEKFRVSLVETLEGVYNINKGFAVFRNIERISENDEYCVIKENTDNGVRLYDHIALDATTAIEASVIYK